VRVFDARREGHTVGIREYYCQPGCAVVKRDTPVRDQRTCASCGYDLRAHSLGVRCPECGSPVVECFRGRTRLQRFVSVLSNPRIWLSTMAILCLLGVGSASERAIEVWVCYRCARFDHRVFYDIRMTGVHSRLARIPVSTSHADQPVNPLTGALDPTGQCHHVWTRAARAKRQSVFGTRQKFGSIIRWAPAVVYNDDFGRFVEASARDSSEFIREIRRRLQEQAQSSDFLLGPWLTDEYDRWESARHQDQ
jgi:hypothetical protein